MTKQELIELCLTFPSSYVDYPFDEVTPVLRHGLNKKMFALIHERNNILSVNLKCEPMRADFLRSIYKAVSPGWHMNKMHWNTVEIGQDVNTDELTEMIAHSFEITKTKTKKRQT